MQNIPIARAVRGAITVNNNSPEEIESATIELLNALLQTNRINNEQIVSVIFTLTHDLNAEFPAKPARIHLGWDDIPMICTQEIPVPNSLQKCIRVMITINTFKTKEEIKHVYLRGARKLRPDLV